MAGLTLTKGQNLSLTKEDPGMTQAMVGLGWDARVTTGDDYDLDASALLVGANGKVRSDADFIFYNQMRDAAGSVVHQGDNRTGEGDGDDEQIMIDLSKVPHDVQRVIIAVSIHDAGTRNQNFGQIRNAFCRIVNNDSNQEVVRYDLSEDYASETAMVFAEVYRNGNEWKFKAVGQGYASGLAGVAQDFGVNI